LTLSGHIIALMLTILLTRHTFGLEVPIFLLTFSLLFQERNDTGISMRRRQLKSRLGKSRTVPKNLKTTQVNQVN